MSSNCSSDSSNEDGPLVRRLLEERNTWRVYGNHKAFFRGAIIIGPVRSWWWLFEIHTIIVTAVFLLEYEKFGSILVSIAGGIGFLVCFISSWKTLLCNPGILKRPPFEEALGNARDAEKRLKRGQSYPTQMRQIDGYTQSCTYCSECQIYRPPRSGHCHICDCCIEDVDHHCPVFGGCIGRKNLFAFHVMAISMSLHHLYLIISSFAVVAIYTKKEENPAWWSASWTLNLSIIAIILTCILPYFLSQLECEKEPKRRRAIGRWSYIRSHQPRAELSTNDLNENNEFESTETDEYHLDRNP